MREMRDGKFGGGGQGSRTPAPSPNPPPPTPYMGTRGKVEGTPHILIIAGEASGDAHGARLVAALQEQLPKAEFVGIGGEALAAQGVRLVARAEDLAVVGLTEVAKRLRPWSTP